jgi:hypothetical protein
MNNITDKNFLIVLLGTILIVFALIYSGNCPESKLIECTIMGKA